jgi:hypothetical protein
MYCVKPAQIRAAFVTMSLMLSTFALGQVSRTTGTVQGSLLDQTESAVVGATIQLTTLTLKRNHPLALGGEHCVSAYQIVRLYSCL